MSTSKMMSKSHGTDSRALGLRERMRQRQRAFLLEVDRDTEQDRKDVMEPFEKPDKMSLGTIIGPGSRMPGQLILDVGRGVEAAGVS